MKQQEQKPNRNLFDSITEELSSAIDWAKSQKHPEVENLTLYDKLYNDRVDGFTNLSIIKEYMRKKQNPKIKLED